MRRAERLFRLVDEMRSRGLARADDLAGRLEVSVRTIYRDIAHLQASGLPIEGEPGVGYLLRPGFDLPPVTLTHDQLAALALGLSHVEGGTDPVLAAAAREVRAKVQAGLPSPETRELADAPYRAVPQGDAASPHMDVVRAAIRERHVLLLDYEDGAGARTQRRVRPLIVWSLPDGWMVSGWCELREGFRTFRLDRMARLAMLDETFEETDRTSLAAFLAQDECETPGRPHR